MLVLFFSLYIDRNAIQTIAAKKRFRNIGALLKMLIYICATHHGTGDHLDDDAAYMTTNRCQSMSPRANATGAMADLERCRQHQVKYPGRLRYHSTKNYIRQSYR